MIGETISHYKILEKIGGGGMGIVYKAHDIRLGRAVAIKFLPPDLTRDVEARERFSQEAKSASALQHPNICTIHDIDETADSRLFIVMDCYEGESLKQMIERGPLPIDKAIDIATQAAQGLAKAHDGGIIHRDIKPANIIIGNDGIVRIIDFGLAKLSGQTMLTKSGSTVGTAAYMSPEQAKGEKVDHRTDIWSLGVVLYEMLTGHKPFESEYEQAMMYAIMSEEPKLIGDLRSDVPGDVIGIVERAMEKDKERRFQSASEMAKALRGEGKPQKRKLPRKKKIVYAMVCGTLVVVATVLILFSTGRGEVYDSIAVLPAESLSSGEEQEIFADGMTTALITELGKVKSLTPIAWQSVKKYKRTDKSVAEIAKELGVKAIVSTQALREKDAVRISVSLIPAASQKPIWQREFNRAFAGILVLQSDVAREIVRELRVTILPQEQERLVTDRTVNPEAYKAYLKGEMYLDRGAEPDFAKAEGFFALAIQIDSAYALAYAGLASLHSSSVMAGYSLPRDGFAKAALAATEALKRDSLLAEAHTVLASVRHKYEWDVAGAEDGYSRAIELNPGSARTRHSYANFLSSRGRFDEALAEIGRAQKLDPLAVMVKRNEGYIYFQMGRFEDAIKATQEVLEMNPSHPLALELLGDCYLMQSKFKEAQAAYEKYANAYPDDIYVKWDFARLYASMGRRDEARRLLNEILVYSKRRFFSPFHLACVYVALGENSRAMDYLEKAFREHDPFLIQYAGFIPLLNGVRMDPRYTALMKKMGFEK